MKKLVKIGLIAVLISISAPAFAQGNVGLLPTNPFYFLKEWGRNFRQAITASPIKKVTLQLQILDEKIAELNKLVEILPKNINGITLAINNYADQISQLQKNFDLLKETSVNPNVDHLLDNLVQRSLKHEQLFNELKLKVAASEILQSRLEEARQALSKTIAAILQRLDEEDRLRPRFERALEQLGDDLNLITGAEFIDRLENYFSGNHQKIILRLKEDWLLKFSARLEVGETAEAKDDILAQLENLPGDPLLRLKVLDEIREKVLNADLKSHLNILRQRLLVRIEAQGQIDWEAANNAIAEARQMIERLEAEISEREGDVSTGVKQLLERSRFNLSQAVALLDEENYGGAFGQATAAGAAAKNALILLASSIEDWQADLQSLRHQYDELFQKAVSLQARAVLAEAEKRIVEVSRLIQTGASNDRIAAVLRNIKLLLAMAEELTPQ